MRVVALGAGHEAALADFLQDFTDAGEDSIPGWFLEDAMPHEEKIAILERQARGEQLPDGHVPATTRFLEHDGRLLGVSNFRHRLTPFLESYGGHLGYSVRPSARGQGHATRLLQAGLEFGRGLGLPALLVTCDPANHASAAVIRRCGGVLIDRAWHEGIAREVCRYHVPVP